MEQNYLQTYFFLGLLILVTVLTFFLFLPFLEVLILSAIFGVVLSPLHRKISHYLGGRESISALIVVLLFAVLIITPLVFLTTRVFDESINIFYELTDVAEVNYISKVTKLIEDPIKNFYPSFSIDLSGYAVNFAGSIATHLSSIISSVFSILTGVILIFISMYFFLKDGDKFKEILIGLSPLNDKYDNEIFSKIRQTINSTVKGVLFISVVQGLLSGIGLWIFGIPNPTLWGSVSAVASLVPGLGTAVIFIPAVTYMYIEGNIAFAIGLGLWGALIVGLIDNILGPYLYSRGIEVHQLIMLFAVLGGLSVFGPIGFLFGPLIISMFFALIEIYQSLILKRT